MRLLLSSITCAVLLAVSASAQEDKNAGLILGKWEAPADKDKVTLEFTKDGRLLLTGNPRPLGFAFRFAKVLDDFRATPGSIPLTYKLPRANKLEIEADFTKLLKGLAGKEPKNAKAREVADISLSEDELTISKDKERLTFKRVK